MKKLSLTIVTLALISSFSASASGGWKGKDPSVLSTIIDFIISDSDKKTKRLVISLSSLRGSFT